MARGTLRIYLGAAPGVGKTYAMLHEGRRRSDRGADVVVGLVETHGRLQTQTQIADLEVVPRRRVVHRAVSFEEMDLDAVVARRPQLALVDELAHTNVPGSRNAKRWEDVDELLDAGVNVLGTLNVQHLESMNDVVAGITGVRQQETIPDAWVRRAEQVELVDMAPDALRRRLAHGNVYAAEKIDAALSNYFRPGNLAALRELALLWTGAWETRERVVVALGGGGHSDGGGLIRRAARLAERSGGELVGVHVVPSDGLTADATAGLEAERSLLEAMGGRFVQVSGADVAPALVQVARAENATQVVLGASRRGRLAELVRGSVINRVIRDAGDVDVHVISRTDGTADVGGGPAPARRGRPPAVSTRRQLLALLAATLALPVLTAVLVPMRDTVGLPTVLLLYLLLSVGVATIGGILPAAATAVAAFLAANYFFTEPYGTLSIVAPEQVVGLSAFVVVTGIVSLLVDRAARRTAEAARARTEAEQLARLASPSLGDQGLDALAEGIRTTFGLDAVAVLHHRGPLAWVSEGAAGPHPPTVPEQADETLPVDDDVVLALRGPRLPAEDRRVLRAYADRVASARHERDLQSAAAETERLAAANALRTALLSAVSHDLRTPLAAIKADVSSLRDGDVRWPADQVRAFLADIELQADRLNRLVGNLLDMSRIATGSLELHLRPIGIDEVVPTALSSIPPVPGRELVVDVPETLPLVLADPGLLERAVANVVENALRHAPEGTAVRLRAERAERTVDLRVVDRGAGIPEDDRERVFEPFQRLGDSGGGGVGLGLAIARGFVDAMGGELFLDDTPGGGLTVVLRLPRRGAEAGR